MLTLQPRVTVHGHPMPSDAQSRFQELYITGPEIADEMSVSRITVIQARKRGLLPGAFVVNGAPVWERAPLKPYLQAWKLVLDVRRGVSA